MTEEQGGWANRQDEMPLISAFPIAHMPVGQPQPRQRPLVKGVPEATGPEGDGEGLPGHWDPAV